MSSLEKKEKERRLYKIVQEINKINFVENSKWTLLGKSWMQPNEVLVFGAACVVDFLSR